MVFISHSSKGDPAARDLRHRLEAELRTRGWDVRVDEDGLRGGEEWRGVLYDWIAACDAAVVLVSRKAMKSTWVRREVNLLLWRRALGSPITILPAFVDITAEDVDPELSEMLDLNAVPPRAGEEFAETIAGRLPALPDLCDASGDRMRLWIAKITGTLEGVRQHQLLRAAVGELDDDEDRNLANIGEWHRFLAHQLLRPGLGERIYRAVRHLSTQVSRMPDLVTLVTPVWVNAEAANALLPRGKRIQAVLNAQVAATGEQYVQRAACCSEFFRFVTVPAVIGEAGRAEFLKLCDDAVRKLLQVPLPWSVKGETPPPDDVCFLVVDLMRAQLEPVADALRSCLAEYPWLNVVILTGELVVGQAQLDALALHDVIILPALRSGEEKIGSQGVGYMKDLLPAERNR